MGRKWYNPGNLLKKAGKGLWDIATLPMDLAVRGVGELTGNEGVNNLGDLASAVGGGVNDVLSYGGGYSPEQQAAIQAGQNAFDWNLERAQQAGGYQDQYMPGMLEQIQNQMTSALGNQGMQYTAPDVYEPFNNQIATWQGASQYGMPTVTNQENFNPYTKGLDQYSQGVNKFLGQVAPGGMQQVDIGQGNAWNWSRAGREPWGAADQFITQSQMGLFGAGQYQNPNQYTPWQAAQYQPGPQDQFLQNLSNPDNMQSLPSTYQDTGFSWNDMGPTSFQWNEPGQGGMGGGGFGRQPAGGGMDMGFGRQPAGGGMQGPQQQAPSAQFGQGQQFGQQMQQAQQSMRNQLGQAQQNQQQMQQVMQPQAPTQPTSPYDANGRMISPPSQQSSPTVSPYDANGRMAPSPGQAQQAPQQQPQQALGANIPGMQSLRQNAQGQPQRQFGQPPQGGMGGGMSGGFGGQGGGYGSTQEMRYNPAQTMQMAQNGGQPQGGGYAAMQSAQLSGGGFPGMGNTSTRYGAPDIGINAPAGIQNMANQGATQRVDIGGMGNWQAPGYTNPAYLQSMMKMPGQMEAWQQPGFLDQFQRQMDFASPIAQLAQAPQTQVQQGQIQDFAGKPTTPGVPTDSLAAMAQQNPYALPTEIAGINPVATQGMNAGQQNQLQNLQNQLTGSQQARQAGAAGANQNIMDVLSGTGTLPQLAPMMNEARRNQESQRQKLEESLALRGIANSSIADQERQALSQQQNSELMNLQTQGMSNLLPMFSNVLQQQMGGGRAEESQRANNLLNILGAGENLTQGAYGRGMGARQQGQSEQAQNFQQRTALNQLGAGNVLGAASLLGNLGGQEFQQQLAGRQQGAAEQEQGFRQDLAQNAQELAALQAGAGMSKDISNLLFGQAVTGEQLGMDRYKTLGNMAIQAGLANEQMRQGAYGRAAGQRALNMQQGGMTADQQLALLGLQGQQALGAGGLLEQMRGGAGERALGRGALAEQERMGANQRAINLGNLGVSQGYLGEAQTQGQFGRAADTARLNDYLATSGLGRAINVSQENRAGQAQQHEQGLNNYQVGNQMGLNAIGMGGQLRNDFTNQDIAQGQLGLQQYLGMSGQGLAQNQQNFNQNAALFGMGTGAMSDIANREFQGMGMGLGRENQTFNQQMGVNQNQYNQLMGGYGMGAGLQNQGFQQGMDLANMGFNQGLGVRNQSWNEFGGMAGLNQGSTNAANQYGLDWTGMGLQGMAFNNPYVQYPSMNIPVESPGLGMSLAMMGGNALNAYLSGG